MAKLKKKNKLKTDKVKAGKVKKFKQPVSATAIADLVEVRIKPVVHYEISISRTASGKSGQSWGSWHTKGLFSEPYTAREMAKHFAEAEGKVHKEVKVIDHTYLVTLKPPPMNEYKAQEGSKTHADVEKSNKAKVVEAPELVEARDKLRKELKIDKDPYLKVIEKVGKRRRLKLAAKSDAKRRTR